MEGYMKVMNDQSEMSPSVSKEMFGIFGYTYMTTLIIIEIFELYDVLVNYRNWKKYRIYLSVKFVFCCQYTSLQVTHNAPVLGLQTLISRNLTEMKDIAKKWE